MRLQAYLVLAFASLAIAQQYVLQEAFGGTTFFDNFDFYTGYDPSQGYVHYVDQATAKQYGMLTVGNTSKWGVDTTMTLDPTANLGRLSVRLVSKQTYNHGLFVLDLAHMPLNQCGTWPAFWTLGPGQWPLSGEIDIIEFSNTIPNDIMAMHTASGCTVAGAGQTGTLVTNDCGADSGFSGCGVSVNNPNNIGNAFNANGGGVYAMEWTSTAIRIWFFPRNSIPPALAEANSGVLPDVTTFGVPVANFEGSCNIDAFFHDHSLLFDIDFCGQWAGNTWSKEGCPMLNPTNGWSSCNEFVAANPKAFTEAYWEVNHLNIYQAKLPTEVTSTTSVSSVTPIISTSSVSIAVSDAQGKSTTPSGTPSSALPPPPASTALSAYSVPQPVAVQTDLPVMCPQMGPGLDMVPCTLESGVPQLNNREASPQNGIGGGTIDWCGVPGAGCPKHFKEINHVLEERNPQPQDDGIIDGGTIDWCGVPGAGCPEQIKTTSVNLEQRDPRPQDDGIIDGGTIDWCGVPGAGCPGNIKSAEDNSLIQLRDAEPQDGIIDGGSIDWCGVPGASCPGNVKIADNDLSIGTREPQPQTIEGGSTDWCGVPGASCNGRVRPQSEDDTITIKPREADPQDGIIDGGSIDWCGVPGASCNGRFKDPNADILPVHEINPDKREASPQILTGGVIGWCGVPGASCNEKFEDPTAPMESLPEQTSEATMTVTASVLLEARFVEVRSLVTIFKRAYRAPPTTVTCTPVMEIVSDGQLIRAGCMAGQDAQVTDDVVVAQATLTIKQSIPAEPLLLDDGNFAIAGIAETAQANIASGRASCAFAIVLAFAFSITAIFML